MPLLTRRGNRDDHRRNRCAPPPTATLVSAVVIGLGVVMVVQVPWLRQVRALVGAVGASRAEPVPLGEVAEAGPLRLRVLEVARDQRATELVLGASPLNEQPREGITYVVVQVRVENAGDRPIFVDANDFGLTGEGGIVRRFLGVLAPEPAIDGVLQPGEAREGWVVLAAPLEERNLLLLFDSLSLPGVWADRVLDLGTGATVPDLAAPVVARNDAGIDPTAPVGYSTPIVTADWQIELLDAVSGAAVFDLVDYRTGALGVEDATGEWDQSYWLALRVRVTNVRAGGEPAYFPVNAFALVDEAGDPLLDVATLTPPRPDAAGDYYPGGSREGWVAFDVPFDYTAATVRFLPYATTNPEPDPRYLTYK